MGRMALGLLLALFLWPGLSAAQVNPDAFEVDTTGSSFKRAPGVRAIRST